VAGGLLIQVLPGCRQKGYSWSRTEVGGPGQHHQCP
jgi:hypothetical protein